MTRESSYGGSVADVATFAGNGACRRAFTFHSRKPKSVPGLAILSGLPP